MITSSLLGQPKRHIHLLAFFSAIAVLLVFHYQPGRLVFESGEAYRQGPHPPEDPSEVDHDFGRVQQGNASRILLVTAFYTLQKSKHSQGSYLGQWLPRMVENIETDIYFFAPPSDPQVEKVLKRRPSHLRLIVDRNFTSPFDVPPLQGLEKAYEANHALDPERNRHNPYLYAIWNAKTFYLEHAIKVMAEQGEEYDYVFWNDAGSFREHSVYKTFPDPRRVGQVFAEAAKASGKDRRDLIFFPIWKLPSTVWKHWNAERGPVTGGTDFSEGSFFGGSPRAIKWWARTFWAYHDLWRKQGHFIGKDQNNYNTLFLLFPERFFTVTTYDWSAPAFQSLPTGWMRWNPFSPNMGPMGACGLEWFYYQFWLSDSATQDEMRKHWLSETWWNWSRSNDSLGCRVTDMLLMTEAFQKSYGPAWNPPQPVINLA